MSALETVGVVATIVAYLVFAVQSAVLAVVDLRSHRLPNRLVLPGYAVAAVLLPVAALGTGHPERMLSTIGGALGLFAFYLVLGMLRPGALGGGDVKLAGVVGAFLGYAGWDSVLGGALAGFVLGGLFGVVLLLTRRGARSMAIAFGPWMLLGAWSALVASALAAL